MIKGLIIIYIKQQSNAKVYILSYLLMASALFRIIPESVKKKTARDAKVLKELKDSRDKSKKERSEKRKVVLANAEKYHKEYTEADKRVIDAKRQAKSVGNFFVEPEHKVAFAIRIKG